MNDSNQDPLQRLFADRKTVTRELLTQVLIERVWLDRDTASFHFFPGVRDRLGRSRSVLTALLAQKALALASASEKESLTPRELEDRTGFKGGTIRPVLQDLTRMGVVAKRGSEYLVLDPMLEPAINAIGGP
jgi:hypothetical protein